MDCSSPGSSAHGILRARVLEWVAIPFSRGSFWPRDRIRVSCIEGSFFTVWASRDPYILGYFIIYQFVNWVYLTLKILLLIPNMYYLKNVFLCFLLRLVFVSMCGLSPVVTSGGYSLGVLLWLLVWWLLSTRSAGSRAMSSGSGCAWPQ